MFIESILQYVFIYYLDFFYDSMMITILTYSL